MSATPVYRLSPLDDCRWIALVDRHPRASVFHSPNWLEALRRTYGYEPVALTTSAPGTALTNGLVVCRIQSWLTGRRLVSLPFSDHCQPLVGDDDELQQLLTALEREWGPRDGKSVEIRSMDAYAGLRTPLEVVPTFCLHRLDLSPSREELFGRLHKDCVQRKIRRAERERLRYQEGRSEALLQAFYRLVILTRQRQRLPPQPLAWFRNLIACLGDHLKIRVASKDDRPVATILTLQYKTTLVYKYGASDRRFSNLGGTQWLLWKAIEEAKCNGLLEFDLGRSRKTNRGLIEFKDRWGATRSELAYLRSPTGRVSRTGESLRKYVAQPILATVPQGLVAKAGRALYRHFG